MLYCDTYNACKNITSPFGVGCYLSGDVLYTYCTPYTSLIARCDRIVNVSVSHLDEANNENDSNHGSCPCNKNHSDHDSDSNSCKRKHHIHGGDYGNCYFCSNY